MTPPRPALIVLLSLLVGCGPAPHAPTVTGCSSPAPASALEVDAMLLNGRASPEPHRVAVPLRSTLQVRVTADQVAQIHIHGYDIEYDAAPDTPGCVSFLADRAGLFDVEAHPDTLLLQLEVR